jgi:hypothetical protein
MENIQAKLYVQVYVCIFIFYSVCWISFCPHADQISPKLSALYKMLSEPGVRYCWRTSVALLQQYLLPAARMQLSLSLPVSEVSWMLFGFMYKIKRKAKRNHVTKNAKGSNFLSMFWPKIWRRTIRDVSSHEAQNELNWFSHLKLVELSLTYVSNLQSDTFHFGDT